MALMRLFYAVPVTGVAAHPLGDACAALRGQPGWRWIDPGNWHVTLAFLGDTDPALLPALTRLGDEVIAGAAPATLQLDRFEWWPGRSQPRLLAAVGESTPLLNRLHDGLKRGLASLGLPVEERPLRPHVTLARLTRAASSVVRAADQPLPPLALILPVAEVTLLRSEPVAGGSRYTPLWRGALHP